MRELEIKNVKTAHYHDFSLNQIYDYIGKSEHSFDFKGVKVFHHTEVARENSVLTSTRYNQEKVIIHIISIQGMKRFFILSPGLLHYCEATGNTHLLWFKRLIDSHFEGIIAHATYKISAGKIEGNKNKIKTIRRQGYGYPDDEYFFLKLFDLSRKDYVRNTPSHKICD